MKDQPSNVLKRGMNSNSQT